MVTKEKAREYRKNFYEKHKPNKDAIIKACEEKLIGIDDYVPSRKTSEYYEEKFKDRIRIVAPKGLTMAEWQEIKKKYKGKIVELEKYYDRKRFI